jgi:DNA-binding NarL/FixJ family response regulator
MKLRVFIADDHAILRDGLKSILNDHAGIEVVGEAEDGRDAVARVVRTKPDVVIMDITMPELNGIEATRRIRASCPSAKILMLSRHRSAEYVHQALRAGASGYLHKNATSAELVRAVMKIASGGRYMDAAASAKLRQTGAMDSNGRVHKKSPLEKLSPREHEILQLAVEGKSSARIAQIMGLSSKTVDTYRSRLMAKLGVDNFRDLIRFAVEHGLTPSA